MQVIDNKYFNNQQEQTFIAKFLTCIATQTPKFDFTLDFMEDKDRTKINAVINSLDLLDDDSKGRLQAAFEGLWHQIQNIDQ